MSRRAKPGQTKSDKLNPGEYRPYSAEMSHVRVSGEGAVLDAPLILSYYPREVVRQLPPGPGGPLSISSQQSSLCYFGATHEQAPKDFGETGRPRKHPLE